MRQANHVCRVRLMGWFKDSSWTKYEIRCVVTNTPLDEATGGEALQMKN